MTSMTKSQLNESRNVIAVLRALYVNKDEQLAQEICETVEDAPAFLRGLEATCISALRVIDHYAPQTGKTGAGLLEHLSAQMAGEDGI